MCPDGLISLARVGSGHLYFFRAIQATLTKVRAAVRTGVGRDAVEISMRQILPPAPQEAYVSCGY